MKLPSLITKLPKSLTTTKPKSDDRLKIVFTLLGEDGVRNSYSFSVNEKHARDMQNFTRAFGHVGEDIISRLAKEQEKIRKKRKKEGQICKSKQV